MLVNPEKNIRQILRQHRSETAKLLGKLQLIDKVCHQVQQVLPIDLHDKVRVHNYHRGTLTLATESAHWLHQLRFMIPELLSDLRQHGLHGLVTIKLIVAPLKTSKASASIMEPLPVITRPADTAGASSLEGCLANIDDQELKSALEQLAKLLRNPSKSD